MSYWISSLKTIAAIVAIALGARLAVPLPGSPVPVTLQTLVVLLVGVLLGGEWGALAVGLYLVAGALGLPVFAAGEAGLGHLLGPAGGFLFGFVAAAWLVGRLAEMDLGARLHTAAGSMLLGHAMIFAAGVPWLGLAVGWGRAVSGGLLPFLPGAVVKSLLAALLWWGWQRRRAEARVGDQP